MLRKGRQNHLRLEFLTRGLGYGIWFQVEDILQVDMGGVVACGGILSMKFKISMTTSYKQSYIAAIALHCTVQVKAGQPHPLSYPVICSNFTLKAPCQDEIVVAPGICWASL